VLGESFLCSAFRFRLILFVLVFDVFGSGNN
jgi:hypothetical protein